jgi:hypothetical protein
MSIVVSPVHLAFKVNSTEHRSQDPSHVQSWSQIEDRNEKDTLEYTSLSSISLESKGIIPNRCAMNSSVRTEVFTSISTKSMATVRLSSLKDPNPQWVVLQGLCVVESLQIYSY